MMHQVRVSYGADDGALSLTPAEAPGADQGNGVLRIGDGCVTLELPTADGKTALLAWDPVEVGLADLGLASSG